MLEDEEPVRPLKQSAQAIHVMCYHPQRCRCPAELATPRHAPICPTRCSRNDSRGPTRRPGGDCIRVEFLPEVRRAVGLAPLLSSHARCRLSFAGCWPAPDLVPGSEHIFLRFGLRSHDLNVFPPSSKTRALRSRMPENHFRIDESDFMILIGFRLR